MKELYERYEILRQIGKGGFSRVYKGVPRKLQLQRAEEDRDVEEEYSIEECVAVKVIRTRDYDSELKRVSDNEIDIMQEISMIKNESDHIVQLVEVFYQPKRVAIVMEYLDGGELFERIISRSKYSELDAAHTLQVIINALNALHEKNIVHRDLKPENLVYKFKARHLEALKKPNEFVDDRTDLLKIMDFGLSLRLNGEDPHKGALYLGTPGYIAPEVLSKGKYSDKSDIFSMGVILYILLSGRMPFAGRTSAVINTKILSGNLKFKAESWDKVNAKAKDLVSKMLVVDPDKRISGAEVLKHPWLVEANWKTKGNDLKMSLVGIREYYARYKFGENVRKTLIDAGNNLKSNLSQLITNAIPMGFTLEDIQKIKTAFIDDNNEIQNPIVTRESFVRIMEKLGFEELPLDAIFDAILEEKPLEESKSTKRIFVKDPNKRRPSVKDRLKIGLDSLSVKAKRRFSARRSKDRKSIKFKENSAKRRQGSVELISKEMADKIVANKEVDKSKQDSMKLDELLIGLSTVAAIESTESFLRFLFNLFNSDPEKPAEKPGLSERGFQKVARVLANYRGKDKSKQLENKEGDERDEDEEDARATIKKKHKLAGDIALLVSSSATSEVKTKGMFVSFEEFHLGLSKMSKDIFQDYLRPQWRRLSVKVEECGKYVLGEGEENYITRSINYIKKVGDIVGDVQEKWNQSKIERSELESGDKIIEEEELKD